MTESKKLRDRIAQVDGGELTDLPADYPYSIVFPPTGSCPVIYTTKMHSASKLLATVGEEAAVGIIGRYGLPHDEDLSRIADVVRDHPLYFLGDCDPFDLLVFTWLRHHLSIRFLGTSDAVVSALGVKVDERMTIPLPENEKLAMLLLREVQPDFSTFIGPVCAALIADNRKLELEALVTFRTSPQTSLLDLLT